MFRPLPFVTMRQQQHETARPLPFRFRRDNELIDDCLRAIGKIAELRFPDAKHVRIVERVAVIETEHGSFGKKTVVDANARLFFREMQQRNIGISRFRIEQHGVPLPECSPPTVLAGQADRRSLEQERSESQCLGKAPIVWAALFQDLAAPIDRASASLSAEC